MLTLLGAALKYNGLSYEQGYRSCCQSGSSQGCDDPSALLSEAVPVADLVSFAIDMLDPYLPAEPALTAMQLVVLNSFDPLSTGFISFENWCLPLLSHDDNALRLARDFKLRGPSLRDSSSLSSHHSAHAVYLLPLPPLPMQHLPQTPPPSQPLPNVLSAESEVQLLLELVSGERAAEAFEAHSATDNGFHMVSDVLPAVAGSSSTASDSRAAKAASPLIAPISHAMRRNIAADSAFEANSGVHIRTVTEPVLRSTSPAGDFSDSRFQSPVTLCCCIVCRQPSEHPVRGGGVYRWVGQARVEAAEATQQSTAAAAAGLKRRVASA
jgi:hypothetical protein